MPKLIEIDRKEINFTIETKVDDYCYNNSDEMIILKILRIIF